MNNIRTYILLAGSLFALASCNDFWILYLMTEQK